jgi:hypothetical protein
MLCPICGKEMTSTGATCYDHIAFTYDLNGKLVGYTDLVEVARGQWQTIKHGVN